VLVKVRRQGSKKSRLSLASSAPLSVALTLLVAAVSPALAQAAKPGDFDRSFGGDGKVRTSFCWHGEGRFASVAIDSHHRIVSAGSGCLSRTRPSGRPDRAFNQAAHAGIANHALAFDGGRIVTAGYYYQHEGFALARHKPNGHFDHSFGTGSIVGAFAARPRARRSTFTNFGDPHASALSVAVDSHRRPVAVGYTQSGDGNADFALARFKWDGTLDTSFGTGGKVTTDFGTDGDYANSMAIDSRGRIVVGGGGPPRSRCGSCTGSAPGFELARYEPDGTLDPSFGAGGKVTTGFGPRAGLNSIAIDSRGRIVAAGFANHDFALARYWPSGNLDRGFSNDGRLTGPLHGMHGGAGFVGIDSRRRIVAVGGGGVRAFRLARYKPNGSLDRSFGRHGKVKTDSGASWVWSAAIDSRDRIVVGASHATGVLARFIGYSGRG
jgi:uncharacterized delta-60 repeat protein